MFGTPVNSGLTLTKVISGISKTLNIANQVIPLYKEAKPMINNARTVLSVLKGMGNTNNNKTNNNNKVIEQKKEPIKNTTISTNSPKFFI